MINNNICYLLKKIVLGILFFLLFLFTIEVKAATSDALKEITKDNSIEIVDLSKMITIQPSSKTMSPQGVEFVTPWSDKPGYVVVTYKNKYDYPENDNWNRIDIISRTSQQITKSIDVVNTEYNSEKYWLGHVNDLTWNSKEKTLYIMRNLNSSDPNSDIPVWNGNYHSVYSAIMGFKFDNFRKVSEVANKGYFGWSLAYDNDKDNYYINSGKYVYRIENIEMLKDITDRNADVDGEKTYSQVFGVDFPMVKQGMDYYKNKLYYCSSVDVENSVESGFDDGDSLIYVFNTSDGSIREGLYLPKSLTSSAELEGLGIDEDTGQVFLLFARKNESSGYREAHIYSPAGQANVSLNVNGGTFADSSNTNNYQIDSNGDIYIDDNGVKNTIMHTAKYALKYKPTLTSNTVSTRKGEPMNSSGGILNYNNPSFLNLKKSGYHVVEGKEWYAKTGNGMIFDQTTRYFASDFCAAIDEPMFKNCDTKLFVNWVPNKVNIKYNMNGGSLSSNHGSKISSSGQNILLNDSNIVQTINHGEQTTEDGLFNYNNEDLINVQRVGYHVVEGAEWKTKDGKIFSQSKMYSSSDFCDTSDSDCTIELFINWEPDVYEIYLDNQGANDSGTDKIYVKYDTGWYNAAEASDVLTQIIIPKKDGYLFKGYYTAKKSGTQVINDSGTILNDKTTLFSNDSILYAHWDLINYDIGYNLNGGSAKNPISYSVESDDITLKNPSKTGYEFIGWTGSNGEVPQKNITILKGSTGNKNYVANYNLINYTIDYNLKGGSANNPVNYNVESDDIILNKPKKTGYTFTGWTGSNGENSQKEVIISKGSIGNKSYVANYSVNKYVVNYNTNGGNNIESVEVAYGTDIPKPANPSKSGYKFVGWYSDVNLTTEFNFNKMPANDITIYAKWTKNDIVINYVLNGGINNSNNPSLLTTGQEVLLHDPSKAGYSFDGWYTDSSFNNRIDSISNSVDYDITIYAKWVKIDYVINYNLKGGKIENPTSYNINSSDITLKNPSKAGYEFIGWTGSNGDVPQKNVTILKGSTGNKNYVANYNLINYTIDYNLKGGTAENPVNYNVESDDIILNKPTKTGYTFTGWTGSNGENPQKEVIIPKGSTGNKSYVANYAVGIYTITFESNGGSTVDSIVKEYQQPISMPTVPHKEGYKFMGWYKDQGLSELFEFNYMPDKNITLYASWVKNTYLIQFDTNGGTKMNSISVEHNDRLVKPTAPYKEGYDFVGWYTDSSLTELYNFDYLVNKDMTLYASFNKKQYLVTFDSNGGSQVENLLVPYGDNIPVPNVPVKEGYIFEGWVTDKLEPYLFGTMPSHDVNLYAKWTAKSYTIIFDSNGGSDVESINKKCGELISPPSNPYKDGYSFAGWYSDSDFKNLYTFTSMPSKNLVLYAKWVKEENVINYILDGGINNSGNPTTYLKGEVKEILEPQKEGYSFNGWYLDETYNNKFCGISSDTDGDLTLYAKWTKKNYMIIFDSNGGSSVQAIVMGYHDQIVKPDDSYREGYSFVGWYLDESLTQPFDYVLMPSKDLNLYAKWTKKDKRILRFDSNGGSKVNDITAEAGELISEPNCPFKENYRFAGWYSDKELTQLYTFSVMPDNDLTVYAKWVKNDSNVIKYDLDGGINNYNNPTYYNLNEEKELFIPTREGYVFEGWYLDKNYSTRIYNISSDFSGDVFLYAKWTKGFVVNVPITSSFISKTVIILGILLLIISGSLYYYVLEKKNN